MPNKIIILLFLLLSIFACNHEANDLAEGFRNPPEDTRPWVYWYWIDENISREGITKDLEAMARVGIGQALIGHVSPGDVRGETKILSEAWWDMVAFAVSEGDRVGVDIGFFNGPGWSQSGGPWIELEQSMRHVVSSEISVHGPAVLKQKLPEPGPYFKRIAVQAFPLRKGSSDPHTIRSVTSHPKTENLRRLIDGDTATTYTFPINANSEASLTMEFEINPVTTIQALTFVMTPVSLYAEVEVQAADGTGTFHPIRKFILDRRNINFQIGPKRFEPASFSLPATRSGTFRLIFRNVNASAGAGFKEIHLTATPVVDQYIDKQLGKMHSHPLPPWDAYRWPAQSEPAAEYLVQPGEIVDLSSHVDTTGTLHWDIPPGDWIILNSGMLPTGAVNVPVPPEATGYECDRFSAEAAEIHFNSFVGRFLREVPASDRKALKAVVIDSYEVGPQNWSDDFAATFLRQYGYDPIPWLPVFSGRVVQTADLSNRFLWDVRRLTADLIAKNYLRTLKELANKNGLNLWLENYGHWGFPAEFLQYGGQADLVSGEFWFENSIWDLGPSECRGASSAAHIYGKTKVFAEAFTAGFNFKQYPGSMKRRGDRMFCEGINHFVLHLYIHQPWDDKVPGVTAWFGMSFQRNNTWFEQSKSWIDYLRRCHYMLQQGEPVTDVCYFIGEDAPMMTGPMVPPLPSGYDYDFINAEVLERSEARDGRLVSPSGKEYRLLILPELETMRAELLEKIETLIAEGVRVYGPAPRRSPGMAGYPTADQRVVQLSRKIWGDSTAVNKVNRSYRAGKVYYGQSLDEILDEIQLAPDVICADTGIVWTHRQAEDLDIYFISNQADREVVTNISFRVEGRVPELWYPDTGGTSVASNYRSVGERTEVPVRFDPAGSLFVVFRRAGRKTSEPGEVHAQAPSVVRVVPVENPWQLHFPKGWDAPDSVTVDRLTSWTEFPDTGMNAGIKYFSGTATYRNTFDLSEEDVANNHNVVLNLGNVMMMAEVLVNGNNLGVLWKMPYKVDITNAIMGGTNHIEVKVTNTWWNRLVGDAKYPEGFPGSDFHSPRTFATTKGWTADDPLLESGLIGPVRVTVSR